MSVGYEGDVYLEVMCAPHNAPRTRTKTHFEAVDEYTVAGCSTLVSIGEVGKRYMVRSSLFELETLSECNAPPGFTILPSCVSILFAPWLKRLVAIIDRRGHLIFIHTGL